MKQLVYCSRATFETVARRDGIEPEVARILMQSRRNNPRRRVGGVLFFGDGHFFQVLEGRPAVVDALMQSLSSDPRHTDVQILLERDVPSRQFRRWSMKYVAVADQVQQLLKQHRVKTFHPHEFSPDLIEALVNLLREASQTAEVAPVDAAAALALQERDQTIATLRRGMQASVAAGLVASVVAIAAWVF